MYVKAAKPGRVALWERHPDHPSGEVFIHTDKPVEVAMTPAVQVRLKSGVLVLAEMEREGVDATNAARELAAEHNIDLWSVTGTGADGRITKADVQAVIDDEPGD